MRDRREIVDKEKRGLIVFVEKVYQEEKFLAASSQATLAQFP